MTLLRLRYLILITGLTLAFPAVAQKPAVKEYRVRVVTKEGIRLRGILDEVTDTHLRIAYTSSRYYQQDEWIPLTAIRKVVVRRTNKAAWRITGAIVGSAVAGLVANESLQKKRTGNPITYIVTLTMASVGGATTGLILSGVLVNLSRRVIRPLDSSNPAINLQRQLEPFSIHYQQNARNPLPGRVNK